MGTNRFYEDSLRARAHQFESSGKLEVRWAERTLARQARQTKKDLLALCKQYSGHRDLMVVVVTQMGTVFTNVQPQQGNPERFAGLCYPVKALGRVTCGTHGTFRFTQVREFYVQQKTGTITRR